ncbi:MAG: Txe/YoeB family addiction module toxin [Cyclobacteriaceae bacterium]
MSNRVAAIVESPFDGIGKPEPLKHELSGFWSGRIDREHRLVCRVRDQVIEVLPVTHTNLQTPKQIANFEDDQTDIH